MILENWALFFIILQTRLLVTHSTTYLPFTDHVIVLRDGVITESGKYHELLEKDGAFAEFINNYSTQNQEDISNTGE